MQTHSDDPDLVARRREHIARCAARVFERKGYEDATVRAVADACDMSIGTLYYYIGTKDDILYLVIDCALTRYLELTEKKLSGLGAVSPTEALKQVLRLLYEHVDAVQDTIILVYHETRNLTASARQACFDMEMRLLTLIENLLTRGCETGEFEIDDIPTVAHNIQVLAEMWAVRRWFLRERYTLEEHIREQTKFILRAICSDKGIAAESSEVGQTVARREVRSNLA